MFCASGWAFVQVLDFFKTIILLFTFAALIAFLLSYPVRWLHRFLPHTVAVILVFFVGITVIGGIAIIVGISFVSQLQQLTSSLPDFFNSLAPLVERLEEFLEKRNILIDLNVIEDQIREKLLTGLELGITYSLATLQRFFTTLLNLILITVIAFFMLLDGERLWVLILKFFPIHLRGRLTRVIQRNLLGFLRGQVILTLFLSTSTFIVFLVLAVPFPLLLALVAGLCDTIPGIGATLGVITVVVFILFAQNIWLACKVLIACIILQQIQDNLIAPRVMQNSININPVVVFFALLVGAKIAGIPGIFIAIPITGVIVNLLDIDEMRGDL
nr:MULTISPECIES: AI-2E family transporter [unclassified Coleofasciculus]